MKRTKIFFAVILLSTIPVVASVQQTDSLTKNNSDTLKSKIPELDKLVVTATRTDVPLKEIASSITVISAEDIEKKRARSVTEVLRGIHGLDVTETGGIGKTSSVSIRGANSGHTLVLVDGIEMNDPVSADRGFNFSNLSVENIERIEIVRGPQSTLYGSDAIGGVINIITKRGTGKTSFSLSAEGGSYETFREVAGMQGCWKWVDYSLGLSRLTTDGFSAANVKDHNSENDGFKNTSFSTRFALIPKDNLKINFISKYTNSETEIDNSGDAEGDDPNNTADYKQAGFIVQTNLTLLNDFWNQKLSYSLMNHDRDYSNGFDLAHPDDSSYSTYDSRVQKLEWQNTLFFHEANILTVGIEAEEENGKYDYFSQSKWGPYSIILKEKVGRIAGGYIQDHIRLFDCFFTTLGVRLDYNEMFDTYGTYRIASTFNIEKTDTKFNGTFGTGFKAPSLYQLYSAYGNENMKPENSIGWDIGAEQRFWKNIFSVKVTYFSNEFENLIKYNHATKKYQNISKAASRGLELTCDINPFKNLELQAYYTYSKAEDKETDKELLQRPLNKVKGNVNYRIFDKASINLEGIHVGKRRDYPYDEMESYTVLNVATVLDITSHVSLLGRIDNLFNREYEEVKGYGTAKISGYTGIKVKF